MSSIKAEQLFRERAFVLSSGDYRISHRSQQSVLKCSLKKNTCLWHHLPFKTASLPSSFPCKTLPQPLNCGYEDKMMPKFIPQQGPLPSFHCIEKRPLHKHARKLVTYLGPLLDPNSGSPCCTQQGEQEGRKFLSASGGKTYRNKEFFALLFPFLHDLIFSAGDGKDYKAVTSNPLPSAPSPSLPFSSLSASSNPLCLFSQTEAGV